MAQIARAGSDAARSNQLPAGQSSAATDVTSGASIQVTQSLSDRHMWTSAANVWRFLLHFLEMQIPMVVGAVVCYLLLRLIPASSTVATVYYPGSYLYATGDIFFLSVPVVAWMIFRGHGWRHSLKMAVAMLSPVAVIIAVDVDGVGQRRAWRRLRIVDTLAYLQVRSADDRRHRQVHAVGGDRGAQRGANARHHVEGTCRLRGDGDAERVVHHAGPQRTHEDARNTVSAGAGAGMGSAKLGESFVLVEPWKRSSAQNNTDLEWNRDRTLVRPLAP
jgi:hypothetical protein